MTTSTNTRWRVAGCLLVLSGLLHTPVSAQPPPPLPETFDGATADEAGDPPVRRIYVPTAELDALLNQDNQGVLLRRDEFRRLFDAARAADENALQTPGGLIVTAADYVAQLHDEQIQLKATVSLRQFDPGWQVVQLPLGGLSLQSALLDGAPAAVARDGQQRQLLMLFCDTPGAHQLRLELSTPLKSVGSDWLAEFQTLGAPAGRLSLHVPQGKSLLIDGLKQPASGEGDDRRYEVPLGGRSHVSLRLTDRDLRHAADALVFAHTAYGLQVMPGEVNWSTQTSVQAYGQSLGQLTFTVPQNLEVAAVESTGLEEWTLGEVGRGRRKRTQIALTYRQPFEGERRVTIRGVLVPESEAWSVPNLVLEDADSHAATLLVRHGPDVRVQSYFGDSVRPVSNPADRSLEFRTMDPQFDLEFRTLGKQRSVQVAMTNLLQIRDDGLDLQTVMDVETEFVSLFDVRVTLPADFEVTRAVVGDQPADWSIGAGAAGVSEVRIALDTPLAPGAALRVTLRAHADPEDWPVENAPVLLAFPEVGLPQANMVEARYGILADADLDVRTSELTGLDPARQADLEGLQQAAAALGQSLRLGFNYQDSVLSGQLQVVRKPTRLAVSTLSLSRLDPQQVHTALQAFVTIEGGGTEGLLIEVPEDTGTDLRFAIHPSPGPGGPVPQSGMVLPFPPVSIVEQTVSEPVNGRRTWALKFDRRMRGDHVLQVTLNQPRSAADEVVLPTTTLVGAERQNGWIAIEARADQNLQVTGLAADGTPLQRVDPVDLPGMGQESDARRIVAGVRYVRPGYSLTVAEQTYETVAVPTALADRMSMVSVLSETGLLLHQWDVAFRAVGMQSLRFRLPAAADVWAVQIDGTPVEVRQAGDTYQLPLASLDEAAAERNLRLIYRSQISETGASGRLQQSPPAIVAVSGSGQVQPLDVLAQDWTLHYPRDLVLLNSRGLFVPAGELVDDSWLARMRDAITLPTLAQAVWRVGVAAGLALLVVCAGAAVRRFGFSRLATFLIVPVILVILIALLLPAVQQSREASIRSQRRNEARQAQFEAENARLEMLADQAASDAGTAAEPTADFEARPTIAPPTNEPLSPFGEVDNMQAMPQAGTPIGDPAQQAGDQVPGGIESFVSPVEVPALGTMRPQARGALLSLSLDLQAPAESRVQTFQTLASDDDASTPRLDVLYGSRSFREAIVLLLAAGLALMMWWLREITWRSRLAWVLASVVVPLALAPITPAWLTMIVEGLLLGGLAGCGLWLLRSLVIALAPLCGDWCSGGSGTSTTGTVIGLLLILGLLSAPGRAIAQEKSSAAESPAATPSDSSLPTVVVPYTGEAPLESERVFLPQELFRQLWLKAHPDDRPRPEAPVAGLVAEALYAIDVPATERPRENDETAQVSVRGRFVLFGLREVSTWLPLPLDQVAITSATIDGQPAVLRAGDQGRPEVRIAGAGLSLLDLEFDLPAALRSGSGELTLPVRPVTAGTLTVTLPPADQKREIRVRGEKSQVIGSQVTTGDAGRQQVQIPIDQGGPLRVSWQPSATRGDGDNIVHVTSSTAVDIGDEGVQIIADYQLQVRQGLLVEVPFRFPESVRLKRISGADVGGWQIAGEGDDRTLTIFLRRNVSDATQVTAELYVPREDRSDVFDISVPSFAPLGVTRETGDVAVLADPHLQVRSTRVEGLRQRDREEVPLPASLTDARSRVRLGWRFVIRPWTLDLAVAPEPPEVSASAEHAVSIGPRKALYASRFRFDLSGAPRQTLRIALTDEFFITRLAGAGIDDWFVEDLELVVDFGQPRVGQVELVLEGHLPRDPADESAVIITPLPLELDRQQSVLAVWVDPVYSATLDTFETWRTIDRQDLPDELRQMQSGPPQFAFRSSNAEPEIINLELLRQQPQISAEAVTLMALSDVSVDYGLTLRWTIERAATDTLVFTVPGWLENQLEITGDTIRQTTQTTTDDGRVRWSVQLNNTVRGQYLLSAVATLPPPADARVVAPDIIFEQPPATAQGTYAPIEAQQTFAVLVNLSQALLRPVGDLGNLTVRRGQLPLVLRDDLLAQAMAMVRVPPQTEVVWSLARASEQAVQAAQVTAAELTSLLAMDGSVRTRCQYRIRNRGQQFLALELPESARVLSVQVKEAPARALNARIGEVPVTLIPLPQTSAADLSFLVHVVLTDHLSGVTRLDTATLGRVIDLPVPRVITSRQSTEFGMPVVSTSWTVQLPEDLEAEIVETVVDGLPRSNLTPQRSPSGWELTELQLYRELDDLNRMVVDKGFTAAQRRKAASNLKVLQGQLEGGRDRSIPEYDRYESLAPADREFAAQTEQLLEESYRNLQQAQQELQQEDTTRPSQPAQSNFAGKDFIIGNNASIVTDNAGRGAVVTDQHFNRFQLESQPAREEASEKSQQPGGQPADSRSLLRGKLQSQQLKLSSPQTPQPQRPAAGQMGIGGGGLAGDERLLPQAIGSGQFGYFDNAGLEPLEGIAVTTPELPGAGDLWSESGGLSLPVELPQQGQSLIFTKLGGDPRLALNVRPRETGTTAIRWVWATVLLVAGAWVLHHLAHGARVPDIRQGLVLTGIALGLIAMLCLPLPLSLLGGVLFVFGCVLGLLDRLLPRVD